MKKYNYLFALVFGIFFMCNCEKDDICAEGTATTPRLIIEFYDKDTSKLISSPVLRVQDVNITEYFDYSSADKIEIPLKTFTNETTIKLIKNGTDSDTSDDITDILIFKYTRTEVYVSRACGYKTVFELDATNPYLFVNQSWIDHLEIETYSIVNENETHVKIYY